MFYGCQFQIRTARLPRFFFWSELVMRTLTNLSACRTFQIARAEPLATELSDAAFTFAAQRQLFIVSTLHDWTHSIGRVVNCCPNLYTIPYYYAVWLSRVLAKSCCESTISPEIRRISRDCHADLRAISTLVSSASSVLCNQC